MKLFTVMLKSLVLALLLTASAHATDKVDINTATAAELDRVLVNVGAAKAQAIIEYRQANGPFKCRGTGTGERHRIEDGRTES